MNNETIPNKQRALVLQGGGALGAYEAGAFKALCEKLRKKDDKGRPLFDIIAGTSIGAINAAIIVSEFLKEKNWKSSAEKLENFWKHVSVPSDIVLERTPWWHNKNRHSASREAARRYYCTKKFTYTGVKNVFTSPTMINDGKFFDMGDTVHDWLPSWITLPNVVKNIWIRYNNEPLKRSLHEFSNFPISTSFDNSEPRLLLVSVDVAEGIAVTFDSYEKEKDGHGNIIRRTEYGGGTPSGKPIKIEYNDGIKLEHVMASAAVPLFYDYQDIEGRKFWDGGLLSNTPLREVIESHKAYWEYKLGSENIEGFIKSAGKQNRQKVPDLEVYIVNVWPSREKVVPTDYDGAKERLNDIMFSDTTDHDVRVAKVVSQQIDLIEKLIALGSHDNQWRKKISEILDEINPQTNKRNIDIIKGQFKIAKLVRIERRDDRHSISGKFSDFTVETINRLIDEGENDAIKALSAPAS